MRLLALFFLSIFYLTATPAFSEISYTYDKWLIKYARDLEKQLITENPTSSISSEETLKKEIEKAKQEVSEKEPVVVHKSWFSSWFSKATETNDSGLKPIKILKKKHHDSNQEKTGDVDPSRKISALQAKLCAMQTQNSSRWADYCENLCTTEEFYTAKRAAIMAFETALSEQEKARALAVYLMAIESESHNFEKNQIMSLLSREGWVQKIIKLYPLSAKALRFHYLRLYTENTQSKPTVCFLFNHPIKASIKIQDYMDIEPSFTGSVDVKDCKVCLTGGAFGATYNVTFREGLSGIYETKLEAPVRASAKIPDQEPRITFVGNGHVFYKGDELLLPVRAVNINKLKIKVIKIDERNITNIGHRLNSNYSDISKDEGALVYEGDVALVDSSNDALSNQDVLRNIPLKSILKDLNPALYAVTIEENNRLKNKYERKNATQYFVISDIGLSTFKADNGLLVTARSLETAEPLSKLKIQLIGRNNTILAETETDNQGKVTLDAALMNGKNGNEPCYVFAFKNKEDFTFLAQNMPGLDLSDFNTSGKATQKKASGFLFLERGIYRPGEVVSINLLARDQENKSIVQTPITLTVIRPDETIVDKQIVTTNDHGYAHYEWKSNVGSHTGNWTIKATLDPKKPIIAETNFTLDDFVPNRLVIDVTSSDKILQTNMPLHIKAEAQYLFGAKGAGLEGNAELLIRKAKAPFPEFKNYQFGLVDEIIGDQRQNLGIITFNEQGQAIIDTKVEPLSVTFYQPLEGLIIIECSEAGGRTQKGKLNLPLYTNPFYIGLRLSEDKNAQQTVHAVAITSDQKPKILQNLGYELIKEETTYSWTRSTDYSPWSYQPQIQDKFITKGTFCLDDKGEASVPMTLSDWGTYRLEVTDPSSGIKSSIRLYKGYGQHTGGHFAPSKLSLLSDKDVYAPGDIATLVLESPFDGKATVLVANHDIVSTKELTLKKGKNEFTVDVLEAFGSGAYVMVSAIRPLKGRKPLNAEQALKV